VYPSVLSLRTAYGTISVLYVRKSHCTTSNLRTRSTYRVEYAIHVEKVLPVLDLRVVPYSTARVPWFYGSSRTTGWIFTKIGTVPSSCTRSLSLG
jgi:hypothetical protein